MARFTTIVALIGQDTGPLVSAVADAATNVGAVLLRDFAAEEPRIRMRVAWREAQRRKTIYTLTDFDPMQPVVDAWAARSKGIEHDLPLEVGAIERMELPEYLLVTEDLQGEIVHWYHGLMHGYSSRRVLAVARLPQAVHGALEHLRADRPFPSAEIVARAALDFVPTDLSRSSDSGRASIATSFVV